MDSRAQFEEWMKKTGKNPPYATKRGYWEIWQASRAAIEIELPDYTDDSDSELSCFDGEYEWGNQAGATYAVEQCAKKIRSAGISIKGESPRV
ncbi:hypothetical protein [Erwinia aphidicola]|uniref:hypothetical protein n=1 Tax=Erwinia aphidicola TaxID=68334 RepID=UPI003D22D41F